MEKRTIVQGVNLSVKAFLIKSRVNIRIENKNALKRGIYEESIKDKFLEIAEFYHWDFDLNDFNEM